MLKLLYKQPLNLSFPTCIAVTLVAWSDMINPSIYIYQSINLYLSIYQIHQSQSIKSINLNLSNLSFSIYKIYHSQSIKSISFNQTISLSIHDMLKICIQSINLSNPSISTYKIYQSHSINLSIISKCKVLLWRKVEFRL